MHTLGTILFMMTIFVSSGLVFSSSAHATTISERILTKNIIKVTGIAEVYGDGEKISAAILEYPGDVDPKSVSPANYIVEGKTIEAVYVNYNPEVSNKNRAGRYVILKFVNENTAFAGELSKKPDGEKNQNRSRDSKDAPMRSDRKLPNLSLKVKQVGNIKGIDDTIYLENNEIIESTSTTAPIIEAFKQYTYTDENGISMPYNIYLP